MQRRGTKKSIPATPQSLPRHHPIGRRRGVVPSRGPRKSNSIKTVIQFLIVFLFISSITVIYKKASAPTQPNTTTTVVDNGSTHTNTNVDASSKTEYKPAVTNSAPVVSEISKPEPVKPFTDHNHSVNTKRRRTTAEANAYMNSQPNQGIEGEQQLKLKLLKLYNLQQKSDTEDSSPIVTRWLGADLPHWLPISSTPQNDIKQWKDKVEALKDEFRAKDKQLYPELHGLKRIKTLSEEEHPVDPIDVNGGGEEVDGEDTTGLVHPDQGSVKSYASPAPPGTHPIIVPTFGAHRSDVDAIFALAEGYDLKIYILFIESLRKTGFTGDLVLSVSALDQLKPGVEDYLKNYQAQDGEVGLNVVAYTVSWTCYEGDGVTVATGAKEGIRKCELVHMYGNEDDALPVKDPREPRPVATARFELYWAWSLHYAKHSWIMLIDSRDTYFQLNPFDTLERDDDDDNRNDGLLYFFEENAKASNIGQSSFNSNWIKNAYGEKALASMAEKPIICSGSTMGEKVAIESYLRAVVQQFDDTKCKLKGCDQGFHNFLYYSGGLNNVEGIRKLQVFPQGEGIINNLGVLRTKPLKEWGLLDDNMNVLNWDESISPVAHQFDRDTDLNNHLKSIRKEWGKEFKEDKGKEGASTGSDIRMSYPYPSLDETIKPIIKPTFGSHRQHVDAVFALAEGYELKIYVLFIESLRRSGFTGDVVLSVSSLDQLKQGVEDYLRSFSTAEGKEGINIVAYTVSWTCFEGDEKTVAKGANEGQRKCKLNGMYADSDGNMVDDPYDARPVATARYELYWAWSLHYGSNNWIMLIDSRDAYFQTNPFADLQRDDENKAEGLLYFFEENGEASNIGASSFNSRWLKSAYGMEKVQPFFEKTIICSGSTMGEQMAIESYLRGMVAQFANTKCKMKGCDQGFHNYLYYSGGLENVRGIEKVVVFEQGKGIINNLGVLRTIPLKQRGILDENMQVLNYDKSISPVAHQWDRDADLNAHLKKVRTDFVSKYYAAKQT